VAAIVLLVFIHFRSITCVVLALLPSASARFDGWLHGLVSRFVQSANIMTLRCHRHRVTTHSHLESLCRGRKPSILAKSTAKPSSCRR